MVRIASDTLKYNLDDSSIFHPAQLSLGEGGLHPGPVNSPHRASINAANKQHLY